MSAFFRVLCLLMIAQLGAAQAPAGMNFLHAGKHDFSEEHLPLKDGWYWSDGALVSPADLNAHVFYPIEFGELWNDVRQSKNGLGVATYVLKVLLPPDVTTYDLKVPSMYSSFRLWANGSEVASNGNPGNSAETSVPQWLPQVITIEARDSLQLVLQISNFHHHLGGCRELLVLGEEHSLTKQFQSQRVMKIIQCLFMLLMAVVFIIVYFAKGRKVITLYFAFLCMTWIVRSLFSNEYVFVHYFPDFNWNAVVRIEYITIYLTMIWAVFFLEELFPREGRPVIVWFFVGVNVLFLFYTLLTAPVIFTLMLNIYLSSVGLLMVYALYVIIAAFVNNRAGSMLLTGGIFLGITIFGFDLMAYEGVIPYHSIVAGIAYIFLFGLIGTVLLGHIGVVKLSETTSDTLKWDDFYGDKK